MSVTVTDDTEALDVPAAASRPRRWASAAAVAFFLLSVVLAALAVSLKSSLDDERGDRRAVEQVSGRFATALLTYDYKRLDDAKERVLALATGTFRSEYERAFSGLDAFLKETQASSTATVTDVFVGALDEDRATSIVVVDAVVRGTSGTRRAAASYIQLDLVKVSGGWRVDGVTNLNFGQSTLPGAGGAPSATTTTTAPR